jgi:nucleotide-binding universal stress UspA family protein
VFCTDGSARSAAACPHATRLAELLGSTTTVVQQVEPDEDVALDERVPPRPVLDAAQSNCAELQRYFETQGITTEAQVVFGETTRAIIDVAASSAAALIALASHGRTGFDRFTLGSTAAALVQRAPCPLFVVGPAAVEPLTTPI